MNLLTIPKNKFINRYLGKAEVFLTVCTHRTIDIDVMRSIMDLAAETKHKFIWSPVRGDALIDRARSRAASYFLQETNAEILLFIDDDIVFHPKQAIKLIDNIMDGADVCGAPYIQKGTLGKTWVQFDGQEITFKKDAPVVEVEAVSTGFMAIHRKVFEKLSKVKNLLHPKTLKFYHFFEPHESEKDGVPIHLGEDWGFCDLARQNGFKIFLDPSLMIGHKGEYVYNMADSLRPPKHRVEDIEITLK